MATLQEALLIAFDLQREGRFSRSRRPSTTISPRATRSAATRQRCWPRRGRGRFAEGWDTWENRWTAEPLCRSVGRFPQPRWSGQPLGGEPMFVTPLPLLTQSSTDKTQSSTGALEGCLLECDVRLRALFR
ncbi:hypothetical protein FH063_005427 [Azospirillum argentinense]|uniref:Uncharacterized protein n=1 Tax=Azospirillum argentinense TaxID=2970906 RepID=A0A2K1G1A2_9PROT|nr:hypothetical protein FH063_005427 [Azospirillum argentinense]PNQ98580.1 hypothetical protein C1S70_12215 [Azospirillum argentinense]